MENIRNVEAPIHLAGVQFFSATSSLSLPAVWKYFEEVVNEIPNKLEPYTDSQCYALCQEFNREGLNGFTYFIGIPVSNFSNLPQFAVAKTLTPGKYAFLQHDSKEGIVAAYQSLRNEIASSDNIIAREYAVEVYKPWSDGVELWQAVADK